MSKRYWMTASDLDAAPPAPEAKRSDEFAPDVARALAELRAAHGHHNLSCEPEGNRPGAIDALRAQLRELVPGLNRRSFLRLSGAAAVFSLAGCGPKHPDSVVPWSVQPEGSTLGNALHYSSTLRDSGAPVAVVVKCYDGRPIKIEGNPDHPLARGRCDTRTQAALLNLYDPDRLQHGPLKRDGDAVTTISWKDLDAAVAGALKEGKVGLITGPIDSPAHKRLIQALGAGLGGRFQHAVLEAYPRQAEAAARQAAYSDATLPAYLPEHAQALVSFGDFLGGPHAGLAEQVAFGDLRRLRRTSQGESLGQVFAFEPTLSQLGSCADVRARVPAHLLAAAAWIIAEDIARGLGTTLPSAAASLIAAGRAALTQALPELAGAPGKNALSFCSSRLLAVKSGGGRSLVWAGGANLQGADSVALHLAVAWLNQALGNEGWTVVAPAKERAAWVDDGSAAALLDAAARGEVETLILWGANPAYVWPSKADGLSKVKTLVALADRLDESASLAHYIVPVLHGLESWGDAESRPGVFSLTQPCIAPLWDTRAAEESLMAFAAGAGVTAFQVDQAMADPEWRSVIAKTTLWQAAANGVASWQGFVRALWSSDIRNFCGSAADEASFWTGALASGVVTVGSGAPARTWSLPDATALSAPAAPSQFGLVLSASRTMRDGEALNNAWLQELPDPVSKICWDTYLAVSPVDAAKMGIERGDVVSLTVGSSSLEVPTHIQEGQDPGTLELFCGWGRTHAGAVADLAPEHDGFRINGFALSAERPFPAVLAATMAKSGRTYQLASPQNHDYMEGRPIALDEVASLRAAAAKPSEAPRWVEGTDGRPDGDVSATGKHVVYAGHRWGMTVDMNTCIGCNACTVACTAENNIPVVGRDEVRKNRVMHWIRIHRYFSGAFDPQGDRAAVVHDKDPRQLLDVEVVHQPMLCQQCDNAPCEAVCPANATMHNDEGINEQVYNRCVGTRYCMNNCPYKVRRFNWYQYSDYRAGPIGSASPVKRIVTNLVKEHQTSAAAEFSHAPLQMLLNPEVTVRHRGVMEKCNFCVQRVRSIRDREHAENRRIKDGEVTTACAQACPTKALVFGDLHDPNSDVVRTAEASGTAYKVLDEELNTRPAISYLRRIRNRPATAAESEPDDAEGRPAAPEQAAGGR